MSTITSHLRRPAVERTTLLWAMLVLDIEVLLVAGFYLIAGETITDPLPTVIYPLVWINVSLWAVATATVQPVSRRRRRFAALAGLGYFLVLAGVGGVLNPGHAFHGHAHGASLSLQLFAHPPGWNPALFYGGPLVSLAVIPYKVAGYAALAYLVYATLVEAVGSAIGGLAGLFSCVSCAWPVVGTVVTGALGGAAGVFAIQHSYALSTVVFLSAIALLRWRPLQR